MTLLTLKATTMAVLAALACAGGAAVAQDRPAALRGRDTPASPTLRSPPPPPPQPQLDQRYRHDHYYPGRGYVTPTLPSGSISIDHRGHTYFFFGGVWFRPDGARFIVTAPPLGIVVPVLPVAYVSLWIGGAPYFYANGVYYAQVRGQGYMVVEPPPGAEVAQPTTRVPLDPIVYPRNGQDAAQTGVDLRECKDWAGAQPDAVGDGEVFRRALEACLDGRGYSVR